jgi:transcription-repair coupling factor (superfamily II helicase)
MTMPAPAALHPAEAEASAAPSIRQAPPSAIAFRLAQALGKARTDLIFIASSDRRAEQTAQALQSFAPDLDVLYFPAWDCLPFDRAAPSREIMGQRMAVLQRLGEGGRALRVLITSPDAALQRLPPPDAIADEILKLETGQPLDRDKLAAFAQRTGYITDERVDEPGELALLGNVVDIFPADAETPVRITDADGVIDSMMRFDPATQRSTEELAELILRPASELITAAETREPGDEHHLAGFYDTLQTLFSYLPKAKLVLGEQVEERIASLIEQIGEAHATARSLSEEAVSASAWAHYIDAKEWSAILKAHKPLPVDRDELAPVPLFSAERNPGRAVARFITGQQAEGYSILLSGNEDGQRRLRSILRRNKLESEALETPGELPPHPGIWLADYQLSQGFTDRAAKLAAIAATDVFDGAADPGHTSVQSLSAPTELRVGDVVVHEDHGVGVLEDLTHIETEGTEQDTIRLRYHGDDTLMVPVGDFGKLWRYGAEVDAVKLDRLDSDKWSKKRAEVSAEIDEAAKALAALAAERIKAKAAVFKPGAADYKRFTARFPFTPTPDQSAAINAVLEDLASGHPMNRLVCGDVGFGKTEVALRAAAAVALSGGQVALVAPTTVLARQHGQSFERRFAGSGITIGHLSRLNTPAEADKVKAGLRTGEIRIVIATHAIAAADVDLPELGLVIIDEEQRFGAKLKRQLEELGKDVHLLSMSATPIPRTLQSAMVGLQEVSVIATPPARRRPVRTSLAPYDAATARTALLREKRRGGQSFVVVPRIEDIAGLEEELGRIVPELSVITAHGDLGARQIDTALLDFANGEGDILLATNIIESGLDVPQANTMLIWHADRFGLSQLHQLRGRVGRGRAQGFCYLLLEPDAEIAEATRARLATLQALDRLGSGFEIAARDLELRGAGDLLGEDQAGHVHLIGAGLYQQLLERALAAAKGETLQALEPAQLNLGLPAFIPADYVPEAVVRINLYARLQRLQKTEDIEDFADELEDRFGEPPEPVQSLLALTSLAFEAASLGITRIDAGPKALALTPGKTADTKKLIKLSGNRLRPSNDRLTADRDGTDDVLAELRSLLALGSHATTSRTPH